ncbi:MAG TPA: aspartyl protease family protein [Gemmatimonadaceae bacterium]|nr:aspartyl protease family protein [Gemmatimonadaceae bacterium]
MGRPFNFLAMVVLTTGELLQPRSVEAQAGFIATLPFAKDGGPAIYLPVRINGGAPGLWRLDSGASECIIDRSVAKNARLAARGGRDLHGAGKGTIRLDSIRSAVHLEIAGRAIATCEHFGAVDLSNATGDANHPLAGILGYEFLARYVVRIDFAAHTLSLYDPGRYRYSGRGDTIELHMIRRTPRVDVRIRTAGRPEVVRRLIVDLGSDDAVDDSTVRRNVDKPGITVSTTGLGKSYEAVIGTLDTVRIGPRLFTNVPGVASDVGIVGSGIWSRFVCIFDYAHDRLFLESP